MKKKYPFLPGLMIAGLAFWPSAQVISQNYFQQQVNYRIHVTLDDVKHELNAFETIEYINNSSDTLTYLYFHLWPNAYSGNKTALAKQLASVNGKQKLFRDNNLKGYIDSLEFRAGDLKVAWDFVDGQPDVCRIELPEMLMPGDTVLLSTPFHIKIPGGITSRSGHTGQSYQISQWYPKPAVYDNHGWHPMPYLDQGEFYSEFGRFDISITLPDDYIVGASGELQNMDEVTMLDKRASDISWLHDADKISGMATSSGTMKTLHYTGDQIHDFAWFADKKFNVLKGKITLPGSGRVVTTMVLFTDTQADLWKDALNYVNNSILYFSNLIGDYPYNTFTAVQTALASGSGMEYPGLSVIGYAEDAYSLDEVIAHEICHNWFYSAIGSDERNFPFLDESITSAYEMRYMKRFYPDKKLWEVYFKNRKLAKFFQIDELPPERMPEIEWLISSRNNIEQPANLPAQEFTELNYNNIIYFKAAQGFNYLRDFLGDSGFDSTMHDYYIKWKSKHPYPADLKKVFESHTGKNLDWFFDDFLGTVKRIDYKAERLNKNSLTVKNKGEMAPPFQIFTMSGDSVISRKWSEGFTGKKRIAVAGNDYSEIKINSLHSMPEINHLNNNIRSSGFIRKSDKVQPQLLFSMEDPDKRALVYMPLLNLNRVDGFMAGLIINNGLLLPKPIEYSIMPFYSFRRNYIAGRGRIALNVTPYNNLIRKATISFEGSQFGATEKLNYQLTITGIDLYFRNRNMNNHLTNRMFGKFITASDLFHIDQVEKAGTSLFWQFGYVLQKTALVNPYSVQGSVETDGYYKKTMAELNYRFSYYGKGNGLDLRIFSGIMLGSNPEFTYYGFAPSARSGRELYLFQGDFPDRFAVNSRSFWSRQVIISEGGFITQLNDSLGYSRWLLSASISSSLPGKAGRLPVKPFVNLLYNDHAKDLNSGFFYEAGIKAGLWGFFEIHVPLLVSDNILSGSVKSRIRFILNFSALHPLRMVTGRTD